MHYLNLVDSLIFLTIGHGIAHESQSQEFAQALMKTFYSHFFDAFLLCRIISQSVGHESQGIVDNDKCNDKTTRMHEAIAMTK